VARVPDLKFAREQWRWRGVERPPFAIVASPGQESVWDYPRPPRLAADSREILVRWGTVEIARTHQAIRVLETAHPPTFYLPWQDVARHLLREAPGSSFCEWKGPARYWSLVDAHRRVASAAWSCPAPLAGAEPLANCVAFYASGLECRVDGELVTPQAGGFYGGWITSELVGPFKGDPGSSGW
jgi:uncharacterized protein (DUF427 family)